MGWLVQVSLMLFAVTGSAWLAELRCECKEREANLHQPVPRTHPRQNLKFQRSGNPQLHATGGVGGLILVNDAISMQLLHVDGTCSGGLIIQL